MLKGASLFILEYEEEEITPAVFALHTKNLSIILICDRD